MQAFCTELAHVHVSLKNVFEAHNFFTVIHLIPKWRPIDYSFVCMLISPLIGRHFGIRCIKTLKLEEINRNALNQLIDPESFGEFCRTNEFEKELFLPKERQAAHCGPSLLSALRQR